MTFTNDQTDTGPGTLWGSITTDLPLAHGRDLDPVRVSTSGLSLERPQNNATLGN